MKGRGLLAFGLFCACLAHLLRQILHALLRQDRRRLGNAKLKVFRLSFCIALALHTLLRQDRRRLGNTKLKVFRLSFCIALALHYLCTMKQQVTIVKVGGKIVETPETLKQLLRNFSALPGLKVLVHGGGRTATDVAAQLGIETLMVDGRRVTDADTLRVVTMVYGGLVNKNAVAQLQSCGVNALGLTGADMNVIRSHRRPLKNGVDYGFVGDVDAVDAKQLALLLNAGITPVMAPLTHDGEGNLLNTNADTIASETAKALAQEFDVTLIYSFEHAGVLTNPDDEQSVIPVITPTTFEQLKNNGTVSGGMLPKLENCLAAVKAGVGRVIITKADHIGSQQGTLIKC